ncbi:MAG: deoxyribose-phosphate aldolase [Clostridia bacterium]|nr:deoxyribose-phosphate aldolase [Clostridia bacterium]
MDVREILAAVDHTLLSVTATREEIVTLCQEAVEYGCAAVCVPPSYVALAKACTQGEVSVCTVVGFPNGYSSTAVKVFETEDAIRNGADEIDMVINIGWLKDRLFSDLLAEIKTVRAACKGKILKVIVETGLLTDDEKSRMCAIVSAAGADYIKTGTGFSAGGAKPEDVALFDRHKGPTLKIKAAGGIRTLEDAEEFLRLGASRLGTSRIVKLVKEQGSI